MTLVGEVTSLLLQIIVKGMERSTTGKGERLPFVTSSTRVHVFVVGFDDTKIVKIIIFSLHFLDYSVSKKRTIGRFVFFSSEVKS